MAFETTVDSGTVNFKTLPDGEIEVYLAAKRLYSLMRKSGTLGSLAVILNFLVFFVGIVAFIPGPNAFAFFIVAVAVGCFVFLMTKKTTKWFSIVPNQGIKFKGGQVAFSDIDTIVTRTKGDLVGLLMNVRGKEVSLAVGTQSEMSYIEQLFKDKSNVRFS